MNREELRKRQERADTELFVISKTEEGFRIYSPASSGKQYLVMLNGETPQCSCPDFEGNKTDRLWRCKHILAVLNQLAKGQPPAAEEDPYDAKEREAIQDQDQPPEKKRTRTPRNGTSQTIIKRRVSPDGQIDSLSVKLSIPTDKATEEEIKQQAEKALKLQAEIVAGFLNGSNSHNEGINQPQNNHHGEPTGGNGGPGNGAVPAQMLNVGGMNTKRGWKFFINVQVNGQTSKLFGSRKELGEFVAAAGFPQLADRVDQGLMLNLPCRVTTERSPDGRYLNIDRVFPAAPVQANGGRAVR